MRYKLMKQNECMKWELMICKIKSKKVDKGVVHLQCRYYVLVNILLQKYQVMERAVHKQQ